MNVRQVRPGEYEALADLTVAAYRSLLGPDMDDGYAAELADVAGRTESADVLVAVDDEGRLLGGVAYFTSASAFGWLHGLDEAGIRMLAVDPAAQGRGVGARLVAACVELALAGGKARISLHTTAPMIVAQRLYDRAGFHRAPERDHLLDEGLLLLAYVRDLER
jgi:ribosomal protein S18 acetylase RimI-like enzyme